LRRSFASAPFLNMGLENAAALSGGCHAEAAARPTAGR
jgi:hypothetical protein